MPNKVLLHINRKFHPPIDDVISVTQKRWGSIWVAYYDKNGQKKIAKAAKYATLTTILCVINNYRVMKSQKPMLGIIELP